MTVKVPHYKPLNNVQIANAIRNEASPEYKRNVPVATQANIRENLENLYHYTAGRNEFVPALINKIGETLVLPYIYENGLAEFKGGMLNSGDTVEEIIVGLARAYTYDPSREYGEGTLFGIEALDVQTSHHKITRTEFYKVTINDLMLKRAFLNDESGLWDFVAQCMASATNADNADEFTQTLALIPEYYRLGGFFKVNVPDITSAGERTDEAKSFLKIVRALCDTLPLRPVTHYNAAKMPMVTKVEDLMLFTTPSAKASLDVDGLAALFNVTLAELPTRIVLIPEEDVADIPGFQGVLTTRNFFVIRDTLIETREQQNAAGLYSNFFFHHHSIISASRFTTAILLTTEPGDEIIRVVTPVTGLDPLEVYDVDTQTLVTKLSRGNRYLAIGSATTTGPNDAVQFDLISLENGPLSPFTRIYQTGGIEIGEDETSTKVIVRMTAIHSDPKVAPIVSDTTMTIVGTGASMWPLAIFPDDDSDGLIEVAPDAPTKVGAVVTIPATNKKSIQYKQAGVDVAPGQLITISASTVFTAVAKLGFEIKTDATASWTLAP